MSKVTLFCFPYAGGAVAGYNGWRAFLDQSIQFRPVELAARGRRMREANYDSIDDAVDDVFNIIRPELNDGPYALFGHSMGSMIAYELAHKIKASGLPGPVHIFFSGRAAPHVSRENKRTFHHLGDVDFKKQLLEMGGTSKEFFEHPELLEVFLPLLKGDFRLTETYVHPPATEPLTCDITVLSGTEDEDRADEVEAWRAYTSGKCTIHYFEGYGHFFIHEAARETVARINQALAGSS